MARQMKTRVAVVGSGMAGLVTAYLLHRDPEQRYQVTLFEEVGACSFFQNDSLLTEPGETAFP